MKKFPITLIPLLAILIVIFLFIFCVPKDGDLISASGDFVLGNGLALSLLVAVVVDIFRFKK